MSLHKSMAMSPGLEVGVGNRSWVPDASASSGPPDVTYPRVISNQALQEHFVWDLENSGDL